MGPKAAALRSVFGIGILLGLVFTSTTPAAAHPGSAASKPSGAHSAASADPLIGPLTRLEARHLGEALHFTPMATASSAQPLGSTPSGLMTSYNKAGLQKEVFAFAPYWALSQESTWNYDVVSTVAYFGLDVKWDGSWDQTTPGWSGFYSQELVDMIARAHRSGDKVVLVIKSEGTAALNDVVTNPSITQLVIDNTIGAMANRGFDGVNIDFEGTGPSPTYPNIQTGLTNFASQMSTQVHQRWPSSFVTIDTYTGSASWSDGLYRIDTLAPVVDAMFIMAYDMSFSNMSGQAGPNAPMTGWTYNDTQSITEYLTKAPASKIILGVPWYGYRFTTNSSAPYAQTSGAQADSYANNFKDLACAHPATRWDTTAQSYWAVWYSPASGDPCGHNAGSWQEMYFDDTQSLGVKYDLANAKGIRGVGIWALGYDGGAPELWSELSTYFSCPASFTLPATVATTQFSVGLSSGSCSVASYDVLQYDSTINWGDWYSIGTAVTGLGTGSAVAEGFAGHTYQFQVRSHSTAGVVSSWATGSTTVAANATLSHGFAGLYTVDAYGGVSQDGSPPLRMSSYWVGWKIGRAGKALPGSVPQSGAVLDGWGGLHSYGAPISFAWNPYWPGWDIARDFAFLPDGSGGYILDGWGGLHPFSVNGKALPPAANIDSYWGGWDIARRVVIFSDGSGGYVLDGFGGIHPFGIGKPRPTAVQLSGYWANWDIIHDIALIPGTHSGYVLDGYGNIHPFTPVGTAMPPSLNVSAYWGGWDIARGVWLLPGSTLTAPGGYTMDGYGGLHPFGNAPAPPPAPYWGGQDIARNLTGY
ncbi:MAG TPA: glycosyl hydrolase family 18 protein [Candidatus Dormibacteraeota bacterium]|nr:glycosyl hydrolase family 18 protein [Candidatus Dormibacteraeota bacterium]